MKTINEHVGWGVNGYDEKTVFCNKCRTVFYTTQSSGKIMQATRIFRKKHQCTGTK